MGMRFIAASMGMAVASRWLPAVAQTVPPGVRSRATRRQAAGRSEDCARQTRRRIQRSGRRASAYDGTGRIFVVERVGKIKVVKDGKIAEKPFLDLTKNSPLGTEVQTGFVEQGLWPSSSIRSSRRTVTSTSATHRCRSMVLTLLRAIRSIRTARTR